MKNEMTEIRIDDMTMFIGGTVNKNPTPGNPGIDVIINGKNYDAIAQYIADILNGDNVRTRKVDNDLDIYDCII